MAEDLSAVHERARQQGEAPVDARARAAQETADAARQGEGSGNGGRVEQSQAAGGSDHSPLREFLRIAGQVRPQQRPARGERVGGGSGRRGHQHPVAAERRERPATDLLIVGDGDYGAELKALAAGADGRLEGALHMHDLLAADTSLVATTLPVGDGMAIAVKGA